MVKKLQAWTACVWLGMGYGAACGALLVSALAVFTVLLRGLVTAAPLVLVGPLAGAGGGALFGWVGGAVAGAMGSLWGRRLGWGVAAPLGGVAVSLVLFGPGLALLSFDQPEMETGALRLFLLVPASIATSLGLAIGRGLQSGRSPLPGVEGLAALIHDAGSGSGAVERASSRAEIVPAGVPAGRGHEVTSIQRRPSCSASRSRDADRRPDLR